MTTIIKTCKKHGDLTIENLIKSGINNEIQQYKCKSCMKEIHRKNYEKNREKINARTSAYKKLHREKYNKLNEKYRQNLTTLISTPSRKEQAPLSGAVLRAQKRLIKILMDLNKLEREND